MKGALLGVDVGTTGARVIAIDLDGNVLRTATAGYPLESPWPGWTEQDPEAWWLAVQTALKEVVAEIDEAALALGLTGQMHGSVFLDASQKVIRPALLWNDQRTVRQCEEITDRVGAQRLLDITGNVAVTGFQAPKILWLREEEPDAYRRVRHVLLPKDFVRLRLTGAHLTDASEASGTLLLDLRARDWSDDVLQRLDIPREWLPGVREGPDPAGNVLPQAASALGLPSGLPVAAGGGDNAAGAVGNGIVEGGSISSSVGTSGVIFAPSDTPRSDAKGRLQSFCHAVPGGYHVMGVTLAAGGSFRWWRDVYGRAPDFDALAALAATAPPGSEGLIFLPYLSGERTPHLDPRARGAFAGLELRHTAAHLTRAVMEGVVYSLKDALDLVQELGLPVGQVLATGGAARNPLWRQIQADVFGIDIHRNLVDEGPAFGAALLAGVACGAYESVADACRRVRLDPDVTKPDSKRHVLYGRYHEAYRNAYAATAPLMHQLAEISTPERSAPL